MTWFRTDDSFSDHPKVHKLQDESKHWKGALSLWLMAGSWCSKNETDGALTMATVKRLGGTAIEAQALVDCRLWEVSETGFQFHDWAVYNPLREKLEVKREEGRQRVAKSREKNPRGNAVTKHNGNAVTDSERTRVVRSTPIPIPIPIPREQDKIPPAPRDGRVDEVWETYVAAVKRHRPRRRPTQPLPADRKAILAHLKAGLTVADLQSACRGLFRSQWHLGQNGTEYLEIKYALKNPSMFIALDDDAMGVSEPITETRPLPEECVDQDAVDAELAKLDARYAS